MTADRIKALEQALRNGSQADMDGVIVTVPRQACEEAADILAALDLTPAPAVEPVAPTAQDAAQVPEIAALIEAARRVQHDISDLVANSAGVAGLHMNGDIAEWESLLPGGSFGAWLGSVDDFDAAIRAIGGDA